MAQDKLLTPDQAAEILGVSPGTLNVWRATKRYPLPYVKVGRSVRYRESDIEAFIVARRRTVETADEIAARLRPRRSGSG